MSQDSPEVVRYSIEATDRSRRTVAERLTLRFPRATAPLVRALFRLSPQSQLRRRVLPYAVRLGLQALNRGDHEAGFALISFPDYETVPPRELVGLGFDPVYRGRDGRLRYHRTWVAEIGEFRQQTGELIDCGGRFLLLTHMKGSGQASGAAFEGEAAYLFTISAGELVREQDFRSHEEALEAVGLSE
jgi:hypothetical protein